MHTDVRGSTAEATSGNPVDSDGIRWKKHRHVAALAFFRISNTVAAAIGRFLHCTGRNGCV